MAEDKSEKSQNEAQATPDNQTSNEKAKKIVALENVLAQMIKNNSVNKKLPDVHYVNSEDTTAILTGNSDIFEYEDIRFGVNFSRYESTFKEAEELGLRTDTRVIIEMRSSNNDLTKLAKNFGFEGIADMSKVQFYYYFDQEGNSAKKVHISGKEDPLLTHGADGTYLGRYKERVQEGLEVDITKETSDLDLSFLTNALEKTILAVSPKSPVN